MSIDDGFRNEFSYVHYRKWGQIELWEGGRISGEPPARQRSADCIEVWHNWTLVGKYKSRTEAAAHIKKLLALAPGPLHDLLEYLS